MIKKTVTISNKLGLHARASTKLVDLAARFGSNITLTVGEKTVNGKSIMGIMMLAASKGTDVELIVEGEDEQAAMDAVVKLMNNKFGEGE